VSRLDRAARALELTRLGSLLLRRPPWSGVLALSYHRIGDAGRSKYDRKGWSASADLLDAHLRLILRHFELIGPGQLDDVVRSGRGRYVVLTFDDGYRDSFDVALPVLRSHGATASFFPITGFVDRPRIPWWDEIAWMVRTSAREAVPSGWWLPEPVSYDEPDRERAVVALLERYKRLPGEETGAFLDWLAEATASGRHPEDGADELWLTWDMVRELRRAGMTIGGHTVTHPVLPSLSPEDQRAEIAGCRKRIEAELGERMTAFAYPGGRFDAVTRECVAAEGVEVAFGHSGGYRPFGPSWDPLDVRRTSISPRIGVRRLRGTLTLPRLFARW
jgi:peptidoglycan/xylan/chitin deacetylase (PgdA/CDA1 family)